MMLRGQNISNEPTLEMLWSTLVLIFDLLSAINRLSDSIQGTGDAAGPFVNVEIKVKTSSEFEAKFPRDLS